MFVFIFEHVEKWRNRYNALLVCETLGQATIECSASLQNNAATVDATDDPKSESIPPQEPCIYWCDASNDGNLGILLR